MVEEKVKTYLKHGKAVVKIAGKEMVVKHIVASAFILDYKKGRAVLCVDGNELNCHMDNLCVVEKKTLGKLTGWKSKAESICVEAPTGERKTYRSVRRAAKALNCSYQTLLDYIYGKVKRSVLEGYKIETLSLREVGGAQR